ncbi:MAG: baseplate J/gp47 family protein [Pyrinomonadaceae bacterium]
MNAETTNLIERPYQEIVDDILTAIVGGVVNEPIIFDVKSILYTLAEPAAAVRSITGLIDTGQPDPDRHTFQNQIDFQFNADKNAVVWQDGGQKPKDETQFYVDYFRPTSRSPLTDINVGSVTRTLGEAIGREIATLYQQINLAYKSGFIDLAEGKALDFVVSILGVTRKTKEFAVGLVTFFRKSGSDGNITIAQGTQISTAKGEAIFETTEPRTLQRGQGRIDVPVRAGEKFKGEVGKVDAGQITSLFQIIDGIDRVNNFEPTFLAAEDETDEELRLRAKAALQGLSKGTIAALLRVADENRVKDVIEISDPNSIKKNDPGKVSMLVDIEAPRFPSLVAALHDVRAAGVQLTVTARFVFVTPRIVAAIKPGLTGDGKSKIEDEIIAALQTYFEKVKTGEPAKGEEMLKAVREVSDVKKQDTSIADVRTLKTDVENANADPLVETLVASLSEVNPSDTQALRNAITGVIEAKAAVLVPSSTRIPDRDLVQSKDGSGKRAADGAIVKGEFLIVPPEAFSLVLEMERTDIILRES